MSCNLTKLKILVVGSGGREHAIAWKLSSSSYVEKIYTIPGNPGMVEFAELIDANVTDIEAIRDIALEKKCDLVVVGPEVPLALGLVDLLQASGIKAFGPTQGAARIESSKAYAKKIMHMMNVPTAMHWEFDTEEEAIAHLLTQEGPIVVKLDGLAAGKGVVVAQNSEEAIVGLKEMFAEGAVGPILIEEYLVGIECSILCVSDGENIITLTPAQDHKRVGEGDTGLNTGGMGTIAPAPAVSLGDIPFIEEKILLPTIKGMKEDGNPFIGVLFAGLMITKDGPKVLEFNCRMGDPETQVVLPMLKSDFGEILWRAVNGDIKGYEPEFYTDACACVIMTSEGYPGKYEKGFEIKLPDASDGSVIFHSGTAIKDGKLVTAGGRVLGVMARGKNLDEALDKSYAIVEKVDFKGAYYRRDIGRVKKLN